MPIKVRSGGSWVQVSDGTDGADGASSIPSGTIVMYNQYSAPTGWSICDGTNGTPDLRDKFIVGASGTGSDNTYPGLSLNSAGGSPNAVLIAHEHKDPTYNGQSGPYETAYTTGGYDYGAQAAPTEKTAIDANGTTTTGNSATQTGTNANLPPYFALTYIMKD